MQLDVADDDVEPCSAFALSGLQHGVGFADAGRVAEEYLQLAAARAALFRLDVGQQCIRIGSLGAHRS